MALTPFTGMHYYGGDVAGSITDNGSQHTAADRLYLDQVLQQLALSQRHYTPLTPAIPIAFSADSDPAGGRLQDGVTYFYRVALIGLDGFEKVASNEVAITMPAVLSPPRAPAIRDAPGGSLPAGLYYYALTAKSDTQESTLSGPSTVSVSVGVNQALSIDAPQDPQGVQLQVWRKKDTDPGYTRLGVIAPGSSFVDDGSIPANTYALDPAYAPPTNNNGRAANSVTITLVGEAATAAEERTITAWRIYRSTISGYFSAQSLVHEVIERDAEDGDDEGPLRTSWVDTGDALKVGQPQVKDRSLPLAPYAPQAVSALPTDTAAYPPNYPVVFEGQLRLLIEGEWKVVGAGLKVTFGGTYPTRARAEDLHYNPAVDSWYRYDGVEWQLVVAHQPALLCGASAPMEAEGIVGDFWLDLSATPAALYGPKADDGWPSAPVPLSAPAPEAPQGGGASSPLLTSPNGTRYRQVVDDDGVVTTVATLEPGPPAAPTDPTLEA